ncbi:anti-sigma factor [Streptomyces cinereoruber]|uniref:anti-sigma factor n=1 Tax=Streptomyces cinereoruber TaxID=67260 RepID=UPI003628C97B
MSRIRKIAKSNIIAAVGGAAVGVFAFQAFATPLPNPDPTGIHRISGSTLAPDLSGTATTRITPGGTEISLQTRGLRVLEPGFYYQGWVRGKGGSVTVGTFHMREESEKIRLWSAVNIADYPELAITVQKEGAGALSSGDIVATASLREDASE